MNAEAFSVDTLVRRIVGVLMIVLAFIAGRNASPFWGLVNFLAFFVVGVTLFRESFRRPK